MIKKMIKVKKIKKVKKFNVTNQSVLKSKKIAQKMIVLKPLNDYLNRALETED